MAAPEQRRECLERNAQERIQIAATAQSLGERIKFRQVVCLVSGLSAELRTHGPGIEHFEDVHPAQFENVAHPALRGYCVQTYFHALERWPFGLRSQVLQSEPVLLRSLRRYQQNLRPWIL